MTLQRLFQAISVLFTVVMLYLAYSFWTDFDAALEATDHTRDNLGQVLAGRFVATAGLALFAAIYPDRRVMILAFGLFAWMSFIDGYIYFSDDLPHWPHTSTGILCLLILGGLLAYRQRHPDAFNITPTTGASRS
ncbi:MAG: hypothetical protein AAF547_03150 [Actinomycetota bacterium]